MYRNMEEEILEVFDNWCDSISGRNSKDPKKWEDEMQELLRIRGDEEEYEDPMRSLMEAMERLEAQERC